MSINNITHLFKEVPLYKKETFHYYKIENDQLVIDFKVLDSLNDYLNIGNKENLITKCIFCGLEELVFKQNLHFEDSDYTKINLTLFETDCGGILSPVYLGNNYSKYNSDYFSFNTANEFEIAILRYIFVCSNKEEHVYFMNLLLTKQNGVIEITKIGQYPESTILSSNKLERKYESILLKIDAMNDYKNATKSKQYSLDVGAYDYERRVLEKIVNFYLTKHDKADLINEKCSFDKKYDVIKNDFDPEIQHLVKPLYCALSSGVHFLTDKECSEFFEDLKNLINIQLEFMTQQNAREESISSSANAMRKLNEKYGKDKK